MVHKGDERAAETDGRNHRESKEGKAVKKSLICHENYRHLVVIAKLVTHEYFLDELSDYELQLLGDNLIYSAQTDWEIARLQMFVAMQPYMKKGMGKKTPQDFLPMPFDEDYTEQDEYGHFTTEEEIRRWREHKKNITISTDAITVSTRDNSEHQRLSSGNETS